MSSQFPDSIRNLLLELLNNMNQVQQQAAVSQHDFENKVVDRVKKRIEELHPELTKIETINAAFFIALNETIDDEKEAEWIVSRLEKCRQANRFDGMFYIHRKYKDNLKFSEMLKVLCAIYRLKLKQYTNPSGKSGDRSIVRREIRCPYCGEMALKLVRFLEVQGIKWEE
jgi:hypothetical protein